MGQVSVDNLERPFFIIFDDEKRVALDLCVGKAGNEGYCEHTHELVLQAQDCRTSWTHPHMTTGYTAQGRSADAKDATRGGAFSDQVSNDQGKFAKESARSDLRLSRGHTHPVFYDAMTRKSGMQRTKTVTFGAVPSNIFGSLDEWNFRLQRIRDAQSSQPDGLAELTQRAQIIQELIIKPRSYKKHCEDYIESFHSTHSPGFNGGGEAGSLFHWIATPRLRQLGVFRVPQDQPGVVIYHPWQVARADADACDASHDDATCNTSTPEDGLVWCSHANCLESVEAFASEVQLLVHMQTQHNARADADQLSL